jgi:acyl-CoA thioesterase YciA
VEAVTTLPTDKDPILRVKTLPNDANKTGDIFGGWLMSQIDMAGAIVASRKAQGHVVTVAVKELKFLRPLFVYDLVSFYGEVVKTGNTSLTVQLEVFAEHLPNKGINKVSEATFVYVAVSEPGVKRTLPKDIPPS